MSEKAWLNRRELQWSDSTPELARRIYSPQEREVFAEEVGDRVRKWKAGGEGYTLLEALEREAASTQEGASLKHKAGTGPFTRLLNRQADILLAYKKGDLRGEAFRRLLLLDTGKNPLIIDPILSNILLGGLAAKTKDGQPLSPKETMDAAYEIVTRAVTMLQSLFNDPVFLGVEPERTDWRSLFEQLIRASIFETYKPTVVTSVGGTEDDPNVASAANILPGLRLVKRLREAGYDAQFVIGFASEFGIACNNLDPEKTRKNQKVSEQLYMACVKRYCPELIAAGAVSVENPTVEEIERQLPADYVEFSREVMQNPSSLGSEFVALRDSLMSTATRKSGDNEVFEKALLYLLSHQLIFRDVQAGTEISPFVIKVGAPSELRFSAFQKLVTEGYMNWKATPTAVMIPNSTPHKNEDVDGKWRYGQITMYYPSLGTRPPYYRETPDEQSVFDAARTGDYESWRRELEGSVERYAALEKLLRNMDIDPNEYFALVTATARAYE